MAYQFVHVETYARKPRKVRGTKDQWNSTKQIFEEALRSREFCKHVEHPRAPVPVLRHGAIPIGDLQALHDLRCREIRETVTASSGKSYSRKLRSDAPTLYTEVHSHPVTSGEFLADRKKYQPEVNRWANLAVKDFRKRMPPGVQFAAVFHLDEANVHMHILALNMMDPRLDANKLHVAKVAAADYRASHRKPQTLSSLPKPELQSRPRKPKKPRLSKNRVTQKKNTEKHERALAEWEEACARAEATNAKKLEAWKKENGRHLHAARKKRKEKNPEKEAFDAGMMRFQDRYYEAVGKPCGLLRKGPGHERLTTKQYAARKASAKARAKEQAANLSFETELEVKEQALEARAKALAEKERRLAAENITMKKKEAEVGDREQALASREKEVEDRERSIKGQEERAGAVQKRVEAISLGLELIRRDQLHWVASDSGRGGRLVAGPRGGPQRPLPLKLHARLSPAMSLLEILLKIIAEIIEDALHEHRKAIAKDAQVLAECRQKLDLTEDPVIAAIFQRNDRGERFEM